MSKIPYVSFDGPDGTGKTTYVSKFKTYLETKGHQVTLVKEPGQTQAGMFIRQSILEKDLGVDTNIELFIADRILTQQQVVIPALDKGHIVISDRSLLSNYVYQGSMISQTKMFEVIRANSSIKTIIQPSLGFIATLPLEETIERLKFRSDERNWIDDKPESYHKELAVMFAEIGRYAPFPVLISDFTQSLKELHEFHYKHMCSILEIQAPSENE